MAYWKLIINNLSINLLSEGLEDVESKYLGEVGDSAYYSPNSVKTILTVLSYVPLYFPGEEKII